MWITVQVRQTDSSSFMLEAGWKSYQQVNRVPLTGYDRSWGLTQVPFQSWRQQKNKTNKSKTHLIWFNLNILLKLWNSFKLLFIWSFIIALLNHTHTPCPSHGQSSNKGNQTSDVSLHTAHICGTFCTYSSVLQYYTRCYCTDGHSRRRAAVLVPIIITWRFLSSS